MRIFKVGQEGSPNHWRTLSLGLFLCRREGKEVFMKDNISLWDVEFENRVVRNLTGIPIRGQQGRWYTEKSLVIARNEREIRVLISEHLNLRPILGKRRYRLNTVKREIKITNIRRIV